MYSRLFWRRAERSFKGPSLGNKHSTIMSTRHKERLKSGLPEDHAGGFLKAETGVAVLYWACGGTHLIQGLLPCPGTHTTDIKLRFCTRLITEKKFVLGDEKS